MEQKYYDAYRRDLVKSFNDNVRNTVNNPLTKEFPEEMLGIIVNNDIKDTSQRWKKEFFYFEKNFKTHGKKFMSQHEWDQFVDSVALETRNKYLKF